MQAPAVAKRYDEFMNNEFVPALFGVVIFSLLFYVACDYALLLQVWIAHRFGARVSRLRWTLWHAGAVVGAGMFAVKS